MIRQIKTAAEPAPNSYLYTHKTCIKNRTLQSFNLPGSRIKNTSKRPMLIWPNITIVVNILIQEMLALTSKAHMKQYEGGCAHKNEVISNIKMQTICDIHVLFVTWKSMPIYFT